MISVAKSRDGRDIARYDVTADFTEVAATFLIAELPRGWRLFFWDRFHEQLTDPGAYVELSREVEGLYFKLGNHGWVGDWKKCDAARMAELVFKHRDSRDESRIGVFDIWEVK